MLQFSSTRRLAAMSANRFALLATAIFATSLVAHAAAAGQCKTLWTKIDFDRCALRPRAARPTPNGRCHRSVLKTSAFARGTQLATDAWVKRARKLNWQTHCVILHRVFHLCLETPIQWLALRGFLAKAKWH